MSPTVERLGALLARVQRNRMKPRAGTVACDAHSNGKKELEELAPVALTEYSSPQVPPRLGAHASPLAALRVLEAREVHLRARALPAGRLGADPGAELAGSCTEPAPADPPSVEIFVDFDFIEEEDTGLGLDTGMAPSKPLPLELALDGGEPQLTALADALEPIADELQAALEPIVEPAPIVMGERIRTTSAVPPSQPIIRTTGDVTATPPLTFGLLLKRTLALRPR